jgi:hypothetical protein
MVELVSWEIWKERNGCVFNNISVQPTQLANSIAEVARQWAQACYLSLSGFL